MATKDPWALREELLQWQGSLAPLEISEGSFRSG